MGSSVRDFVKYESNDDNMPKLFYNMSATMKYIHKHDYYIKSFNLSDINIIDTENLSPIQYEKIEKIEEEKEKIINSNIHTLALLQLGAYSKTLDHFNVNFAEKNFEEFELFIPENDIPYLKGTIQRNSPVYYCDFVDARNKREMEKIETVTGKTSSFDGGRQISKSTAVGRAMTDKETEKLYKNSLEDRQAAFTTFLILPLTMILLGIVLSIIALIIH